MTLGKCLIPCSASSPVCKVAMTLLVTNYIPTDVVRTETNVFQVQVTVSTQYALEHMVT